MKKGFLITCASVAVMSITVGYAFISIYRDNDSDYISHAVDPTPYNGSIEFSRYTSTLVSGTFMSGKYVMRNSLKQSGIYIYANVDCYVNDYDETFANFYYESNNITFSFEDGCGFNSFQSIQSVSYSRNRRSPSCYLSLYYSSDGTWSYSNVAILSESSYTVDLSSYDAKYIKIQQRGQGYIDSITIRYSCVSN